MQRWPAKIAGINCRAGLLAACLLVLLGPCLVHGTDNDTAALDFARRLRENGPLTKEEREWVHKHQRERRLTVLQLADHIEKCWYLSEKMERNPELRPKKRAKTHPQGDNPLAYSWRGPVVMSLIIGALLLATVFVLQWLRERHRWLQHMQEVADAKSATDLVQAAPGMPHAEEGLPPQDPSSKPPAQR